MSGYHVILTGRIQVRKMWRAKLVLQVEQVLMDDDRPVKTYWVDALPEHLCDPKVAKLFATANDIGVSMNGSGTPFDGGL